MASQRKRTRDEEDKEKMESKKQECVYNDSNVEDDKWYEFRDGVGVFDFPWLKEGEGVVFKGEDYLDDEDEKKFSHCLDGSLAPNIEGHNLCASPTLYDHFDDDSFWSLLVDDLEPLDCIWSCVIDQPLLDIGFNKG